MKGRVALGKELCNRTERFVEVHVSVDVKWRNGRVEYEREELCAGWGGIGFTALEAVEFSAAQVDARIVAMIDLEYPYDQSPYVVHARRDAS